MIEYEVFSVEVEKIRFRDAIRRGPTVTISRAGEEYATIEFSKHTDFAFRSDSVQLEGRTGRMVVDRSSNQWYLEAHREGTKVNVIEAMAIMRYTPQANICVVSIQGLEISHWTFDRDTTRVTNNDEAIIAEKTLVSSFDQTKLEVKIAKNIEGSTRDYLLAAILMFRVKLPWYSFSNAYVVKAY